MSNATKTLFATLLITTFGALILSHWNSLSAPETTDGAAIPEFDITEVDRITIENATSGGWIEVSYNHEAERWEVHLSENGRNESPEEVNDFIEALSKPDIHREVTSNPSRHSDYHVDHTGIQLRWYKDGNEKGGVILGRFNFEGAGGAEVFIRPMESDGVYAADVNLITTTQRLQELYR